MTQQQTLAFANFSAAGDCVGEDQIDLVSIDADLTSELERKFSQLSGDLDLPLEIPVGQEPPVIVRFCTEFHAAYAIYYVGESALFASLVLSGNDENAELELMQVFKFLLLDDGDDEEPSEEAIEELLSADEFKFDEFTQRPIAFQLRLSDAPEDDDLSQQLADIDQSVALAFLKHPKVNALEIK